MKFFKGLYRFLRGIFFSAIIFVAAVYLILYICLSIPWCQNVIKEKVCKEVSVFVGSEVRIEHLLIKPFNEVIVKNLEVLDPTGETCISVQTLGAGITLNRFLREGKIEISYAEVIGLEAKVVQPDSAGRYNIDFLVEAFKPKDKNKPPVKFDLNLRNVVIRRSIVNFDRLWAARKNTDGTTDFNHFRLFDLKADLNLPRLADDGVVIDLRRLAFNLSGGLKVEKVAFKSEITPNYISLNNLILELPGTEIKPSDIFLSFSDFKDIKQSLKTGRHIVKIDNGRLTLSDFRWLTPYLAQFTEPLNLDLHLEGNLNRIDFCELFLSEEYDNSAMSLNCSLSAENLNNMDNLLITAEDLKIKLDRGYTSRIADCFAYNNQKVRSILRNLGDIFVSADGIITPASGNMELNSFVTTSSGDVYVKGTADGLRDKRTGKIKGELSVKDFAAGLIFGLPGVGPATGEINFNLEGLTKENLEGDLSAVISRLEVNGISIEGLSLNAYKSKNTFGCDLNIDDETVAVNLNAEGALDAENSWCRLNSFIENLRVSRLGYLSKYRDYSLKGHIGLDVRGNSLDNIVGELHLSDMIFESSDPLAKRLRLGNLLLKTESEDEMKRVSIGSDWVSGIVYGRYKYSEVGRELSGIFSKILPALTGGEKVAPHSETDLRFNFEIAPDNSLTDFLNLPFKFLVPVSLNGKIESAEERAELHLSAPYLQQGKNKLMSNTILDATLDGVAGNLFLDASTTYPVKNHDVKFNLSLSGKDDDLLTDISWIRPDDSSFKGNLKFDTHLSGNQNQKVPEAVISVNPSIIDFGAARWGLDKANISYSDKKLEVNGLKVTHKNQLLEISGIASSSPLDSLSVNLASIDIGYIFDTLNIKNLSFGGNATGNLTGSSLLGSDPVITTDNLHITDFSYNETLLGEALLNSSWDNSNKKIGIGGKVTGDLSNTTLIDGGIWLSRDSLRFDFKADKIPVGFLQPFMTAFSSGISGRATGDVRLYGNYKALDLMGNVKADSVTLKLSHTNVAYHGSDSILLKPGEITIPAFTLYDRDGHTSIFSGRLLHNNFRDSRYSFRVSDINDMLCFDTDASVNPVWYGTLYGNGSAALTGSPGRVNISVDMRTTGNSSFTFVINDTQAADDFTFLTFSDRRKPAYEEVKRDSVADLLAAFRKRVAAADSLPSNVQMDLRLGVTPNTLITLIMDPVTGDKITARGNGNVQVDYNSGRDAMLMYGKYSLEEGTYNFSLQDLILRDFNIRRGSTISFNGNPLNALLDITAGYRVNTNLSDLDKSFSTDRELTRTNVPVDALLMVEGELQHPDISFDIELPTLTQDVERKVKSIISTDDMMNRQMIYLLALNRFYTPEYMGITSNGGELASVASTTLSSQLSSMIGQLTDKFTVAPSFRSDKGDFSDLEFDVSLSSRLLNNRLLINGNFGYRDRTTSQTTFVGDFDIEYLLNRRGNLRLKAYNHFNDQNYYLRQALTTQGLGVIYRKEFNNPFSFLRRNRTTTVSELGDTPKQTGENDPEEVPENLPFNDKVGDKGVIAPGVSDESEKEK